MPDHEELLTELHSALAHLDDPPYLETHPLARRLSFVADAPGLSRGQMLRRALRLAIAALDPGSNSLPTGVGARSYQVLYRWAVSKQGMVGIAQSLGISRRQAYRELRQAIEALAQILDGLSFSRDQQPEQITDSETSRRALQLRDELERLSQVADQDVDLDRLVAEVIENAQHLADDRRVRLRLQVASPGLRVSANRVMLRQAILNLLSHIVSDHATGTITVRIASSERDALLQVRYRRAEPPAPPLPPRNPYAIATQLLESLAIPWTQSAPGERQACISMRIPLAKERSLLIVDDNEGVIALFRRYLRGQPYQVYGARSGDEAMAMLEELQPDVVILDVMMPDRDGWEVLQTFRRSQAGRAARVIICSIINDPKLAAALGADAFLNKPVDRASLLQALDAALSSADT